MFVVFVNTCHLCYCQLTLFYVFAGILKIAVRKHSEFSVQEIAVRKHSEFSVQDCVILHGY